MRDINLQSLKVASHFMCPLVYFGLLASVSYVEF